MLKRWWKDVRRWVEDWVTAPRRCARAEREVRLQRSINTALGVKVRRLEQERERECSVLGDVPGLSPAEVERLAILAENCGAVAKAIGKVVRFGWESSSPYGGRPNRATLEREIGNVRAIVNLMLDAEDLRLNELQAWQRSKRAALAKWTLYQECSMPREEQLGMMASIAENVQAAD